MKKQVAVNTFQNGLVMDINPLVTPNQYMTHCLNGTLVTFNGNENALQNDMGNGRVETAMLPEGYIPMGTCSFGGIIYIASYNPEKKLSQIGCFPSPERNITSDEIFRDRKSIQESDFITSEDGLNHIKTALKKLELSDIEFSPGDKYKIYFGDNPEDNLEDNPENNPYRNITDYNSTTHNIGDNPKYLRIHVVSVGDNSIQYLDNGLKWFKTQGTIEGDTIIANDGEPAYFISPYAETILKEDSTVVNLDQYRTLVNTPYNIFKADSKGKLALFFELEVIDSFSFTWRAEPNDENTPDGTYTIEGTFEWEAENNTKPSWVFLTDSIAQNVGNLITTNEVSKPYIQITNDNSQSQKITVTPNEDKLWKYTFTPSMEFGLIDYLAVKGQIDFNQFANHSVQIPVWKYYNNTSTNNTTGSLLLQFESQAYLSPGEEVKEIQLQFIPLVSLKKFKDSLPENPTEGDTQNPTENPTEGDTSIQKLPENFTEEDILKYDLAIYTIKNKKSYSGIFVQSIPYEADSLNLQGVLHENYVYGVQIVYKYEGHDSEIIKKTVITNSVFNTEYTNKGENDFSTLYLSDYLEIQPKAETTDNINIKYSDESKSSNDVDINEYIASIESSGGKKSTLTLKVSAELINNYNTFNITNYCNIDEVKIDKEALTIDNGGIILQNVTELNIGNHIQSQISSNNSKVDIAEPSVQGNNITLSLKGNLYKYTQYTKESFDIQVDDIITPIIYNEESLNRYGIITNEQHTKFNFQQIGTMCYTDESGRKASVVCGLASLADSKYRRSSLQYACPGYNDDNNVYYLGSNTYKSDEKNPLSKFVDIANPKVGIDTAINGICNIVGTPIVAVAYAGYRKDDQRLKKVRINKSDTVLGNDGIYIDENGFSSNSTLCSLFVKTQKGDYIPINQAGLITNNNFVGIEKLLVLLSQLYYKSNISQPISTDRVLGIIYSDPQMAYLNVICTLDIQVDKNLAIYIKGRYDDTEYKLSDLKTQCTNFEFPTNNIDIEKEYIIEDKTITGLYAKGNQIVIQYGIYLDDSKKVFELQQKMNPNIISGILLNDGSIIKSDTNYKPNQLYYVKDNKANILDSGFEPIDGELKFNAETNTYILTSNGTDKTQISDKNYLLPSYLGIQDGSLYIKNKELAHTMDIIMTDSANHNGTIKQIPDIKLIKNMAK